MVKLLEKGDFYSKIAKVSIYLLLGAVAHGVKEKEKTRFIVNLFIRCKETQNNLAQLLEAKKKENKKSRLKPTMSAVFFVYVFIFSLSWKCWPQPACENASFAFLAYV